MKRSAIGVRFLAALVVLGLLAAAPVLGQGRDHPRVTSTAVSPDFKYLLVGYSRNRRAELWDLGKGEIVRYFPASASVSTSFSWSPDNKTVTVTTVDTHESKEETIVREYDFVHSLWNSPTQPPPKLEGLLSPDGKWTVTHLKGILELKDAETKKLIRKIGPITEHPEFAWDIRFSPDNRFLIVDDQRALTFWKITGERAWSVEGGSWGAGGPAFSADRTLLLLESAEGNSELREVATGKVLQTFKGHKTKGVARGFLPDGKHVLVDGDPELAIWEIETGRRVRALEPPPTSRGSFIFSPDSKRMLFVGDGYAVLYDLTTGEEIRTLFGPPPSGHDILSLALSKDGEYALVGGPRKALTLWHLPTGKPGRTFPTLLTSVMSLAMSPDGRFALSAGQEHQVELWDLSTGERLHTLEEHESWSYALGFIPSRNELITTDRRGIRIWDQATGKERRKIEVSMRHGGVVIGPSGLEVLAWGEASLYTTKDGTKKAVKQLEEANFSEDASLTWSLDGKYLATGGRDVKLYVGPGGKGVTKTLVEEGKHRNLQVVAFSPDSRFLLSGDEEGKLCLWEVETGSLVRTFRGKGVGATINTIAFTADGKKVVTGGNGGTLKLWDVETGKQLKDFRLPQED